MGMAVQNGNDDVDKNDGSNDDVAGPVRKIDDGDDNGKDGDDDAAVAAAVEKENRLGLEVHTVRDNSSQLQKQ
jgi:hypothetical protein